MVYIYILGLQHNKYYVGKTNNPCMRINSHQKHQGSEWTKKYPPIEVIKIIENCDDYDEDKYTLKYMAKYGIDNVRGGSFCTIELDNNSLEMINKMLRGSNNQCYRCGATDHFVRDCQLQNNIYCYICHRTSHNAYQCYAKKDKYGHPIQHRQICFKCGETGHSFIVCSNETDIFGNPTKDIIFDNISTTLKDVGDTFENMAEKVINNVENFFESIFNNTPQN